MMKKLITLVLALVCAAVLSGCAWGNGVPTLEDVQDYTEEDFEIYLYRVKRAALIREWGEPDGTTSESGTDTWVLSEKQTVTVIYDTSNRVKDVDVEKTE